MIALVGQDGLRIPPLNRFAWRWCSVARTAIRWTALVLLRETFVGSLGKLLVPREGQGRA